MSLVGFYMHLSISIKAIHGSSWNSVLEELVVSELPSEFTPQLLPFLRLCLLNYVQNTTQSLFIIQAW